MGILEKISSHDDLVNLTLQHTGHGPHILCYLIVERISHGSSLCIAGFHLLVYLSHIVGAKVCIEATLTYDFAVNFLFGIFSGEAHLDQGTAGDAALSGENAPSPSSALNTSMI